MAFLLRSRAAIAVSAAIARRPVLSASCFLSAKYCIADVMVQSGTQAQDKGFDSARLGLFTGFGFYYGAVNYYIYRAIEKWPWGGHWRAVIGMSLFDIFIHLKWFFFPQFYFARACIYAEPRPTTATEFSQCVISGLQTWRENFVEDLKTLIAIFGPINLVMFNLPLHLRTPFLSTVGLTFPIVLSWLRGERSE